MTEGGGGRKKRERKAKRCKSDKGRKKEETKK